MPVRFSIVDSPVFSLKWSTLQFVLTDPRRGLTPATIYAIVESNLPGSDTYDPTCSSLTNQASERSEPLAPSLFDPGDPYSSESGR